MKQQWTGTKGKQRWLCGFCDRDFRTRRGVLAHQVERHSDESEEVMRGAVQWG